MVWSESPVSISASTPYGYVATRIRKNGTWTRFVIGLNSKWSYDSKMIVKYALTQSNSSPEIDRTNQDPGGEWSDQVTGTGYLWMITATKVQMVIDTASLYLRVNTILYFVTAVICILRNAMQGIGDSITPVISSSLELLCKVLIAFLLTPYLGYLAIILSEPVSWVIMVIPLLVGIKKNKFISESI